MAANWATPIGFDGQVFEPTVNSIRLTISNGATLQGSIGRIGNRIHHMGILVVSIYTDGAAGSAAWRGYVETLTNLLFDKQLTTTGATSTTINDIFVRFSPDLLGAARHPYVSASYKQTPFHVTNLTAPFVRYETR